MNFSPQTLLAVQITLALVAAVGTPLYAFWLMKEHSMDKNEAQAALDTYPDQSPFWDARTGQQVLAFAAENGLTPTNTNKDRWAITYAQRPAVSVDASISRGRLFSHNKSE